MTIETRKTSIIKAAVFVFFFMAFILISGKTAFAMTGTTWTSSGTGTVSMREEPSTDGALVTSVPAGSKVEILGSSGDWYKVSINGKTGYIRSDLIIEDEDGEVPAVSDNDSSNTSSEGNSAANNASNNTDADDADDADDDNTEDFTTNNDTMTVMLGEWVLTLEEDYDASILPDEFEPAKVLYQGTEVRGAYSEVMDIYLLVTHTDDVYDYMVIYFPEDESVYPFVQIFNVLDEYILPLPPEEGTLVDEPYASTTLYLDAQDLMVGFTESEGEVAVDGVMFVYAVDNSGNKGWYLYDYEYYTFIRSCGMNDSRTAALENLGAAYNELKEAYIEKKNGLHKIIAWLVIAIAILVIVIINIVVLGSKKLKAAGIASGEDGEENNDDLLLTKEEKRKAKRALKAEKKKNKKDFWDLDLDDDEDDEEEEEEVKPTKKEKKAEKEAARKAEAEKEAIDKAEPEEDDDLFRVELDPDDIKSVMADVAMDNMVSSITKEAEMEATKEFGVAKQEAPKTNHMIDFDVDDFSSKIIEAQADDSEEDDDMGFLNNAGNLEYEERMKIAETFKDPIDAWNEGGEPVVKSETTGDGFEFFDFDE